jgi:hypothetical protein
MMMMTPLQDDGRPVDGSSGGDSAEASPLSAVEHGRAAALSAPFAPRWDRIVVVMIGLLALCAAPITLLLGFLNVVSLVVPLACLGVAAAAVAVLRTLAIRSRRARVDAAFAEAMAPVRAVPAPAAAPAPAAPRRPTALFDAERSAARPPTPMELRTAALAVAHGSSAVIVRAGAQGDAPPSDTTAPAADGPAGATAWVPVELPRPTYVDAAKAERDAPAPLDLPEAPRPTSRTPIKAAEAAARDAAATAAPTGVSMDASASTGRINLDDVLQRRRA